MGKGSRIMVPNNVEQQKATGSNIFSELTKSWYCPPALQVKAVDASVFF